jgi:hypothetical protein
MNKAEFTGFLTQACRNLAAYSAGGSLHFICGGPTVRIQLPPAASPGLTSISAP